MSQPDAAVTAIPTSTLTDRLAATWHRFALAGILGLAALLNLWNLDRNGYANEYYSAAVRSMLSSWSNFLFVSFDPGGLVSVDKPPLALWLAAGSAKLLGYSGWTIILPSALAGIAAVWVLYLLVARVFGHVAGLVAALALAVSPVSVAINRDNNPDAVFALLLVLAAYAVVRALEQGSLRWLLGAAVFVGLAFNTKMLAAFIVLPALALAYLVFAPLGWRSRILRLLAAGGVLTLVSSAWVLAVELTPAASRPYVGSTEDNSALSLVLGYNGLGRITGQTGGTSTGGGLGGAFSGQPGWLRLWNEALGEQGAWLLPLAIVGGLSAIVAAARLRSRLELGTLVAVGGWFLTAAAVFSFASGIIHTYYLNALAPATSGLVGIGAVALWRDVRAGTWRLALPVTALAISAWLQLDLLRRSGYLPWLQGAVVVGTVASIALIFVARLRPTHRRRLATAAVATGVGVLLLAPAAWSRTTLLGAVNGVFPGAGPSFVPGLGSGSGFSAMGGPGGRRGFGAGAFPGAGTGGAPPGMGAGGTGQGGFFGNGSGPGAPPAGRMPGGGFGASPPAGGMPGGGGMFGGSDTTARAALAYAEANGATDPLALVVSSEQQAAGLVIEGEAVGSLGGFTGRETVLTPETLSRLVRADKVRYFLLGGSRGGPGGTANAAADLISSTCTLVPGESWQNDSAGSSTAQTGAFGGTTEAALYDCGGKADELAAG